MILLIDFLIRGLFSGKYSFLTLFSNLIIKTFRINPVMINSGPKVFAARIGFILILLSLLFLVFDLRLYAYITASVFIFFAFLESVFGFCVACKIYPLFYRNRFIKRLKWT